MGGSRETIGAGKTEAVDFAFPTDGSSEKGVWTVLYFLYDGEEFLGADRGGRFTVGYEPADYSSFKAIVTIRDPEGNAILEEEQEITIAPGETGNIPVSLSDSSATGIWSARYSVLMSDNTVLLSSLKRFARSVYAESTGGWNYQASKIGFDVVSDHDQVVEGGNETFLIHIYNRGDSAVDIHYEFDWNHRLTGDEGNVNVPAGSTGAVTHTTAIPSFGRFWVHFYQVGGGYLGQASKGIATYLPYTDVSVTADKSSYTAGDSIAAAVEMTNMGLVPQDTHTVVLIQDGRLNTLLEQSFDTTLQPYTAGGSATQTRQLTLTLPAGMATGPYRLTAVAYKGTERTGQGTTYFYFASPYSISINLDRPWFSYEAGEAISISVEVKNLGASPRQSDVEVAVPDLGSPLTTHVTLDPGAAQTINYPVTTVPVDIASGLHRITVTVADGGYTKSAGFAISAVELSLGLTSSSYSAGDTLSLSIQNTSGVRALWSCTLTSNFAAGPVTGTGTLMPGVTDNTSMNMAIPVSTEPGQYYVQAQCQASGSTFYMAQYVNIAGSEIVLTLADTTYNAGEEVSITMTNTGVLDTTATCSIDLTDRYASAVYQESGTSKSLPGGGGGTLPFTIPAWAAGGQYRLEATCVDNLTSRGSSLATYLDVSGVEASLTSVTDNETYSSSENINVQTHIVNSALPLSGTLHLWMWEAVKSEAAVRQVWAGHYDAGASDTAVAMAVDSAGNVYITGTTYTSFVNNYVTAKYSPDGTRQWAVTYNGTGNADGPAGGDSRRQQRQRLRDR